MIREAYEIRQVVNSMEMEFEEGILPPELQGYYKALKWVLCEQEDFGGEPDE